MLEASELLQNSAAAAGGGATAAVSMSAAVNLEDNGAGGFGEEEGVTGGEGDRNFPGNRWPREETLALLKIRSEMDVAFRDSTIKAPLWDEVSRKLAELGYHRSSKKCKEKFENIYKYHKRTKECRSGRQNGKSYRFFEQLELFDHQSSFPLPCVAETTTTTTTIGTAAASMATTVVPAMNNPLRVSQDVNVPHSIPISNAEFFMSASTSTTSSSDKESVGNGRKKRKLAEYFGRLMKKVLEKQENMQSKFIEALEKCEQDRIAREEEWKTQELARIKREKELLVQERAIAAAKDAAVLAFLQKISEQAGPLQLPEKTIPENPIPIPAPVPVPAPATAPSVKAFCKKQENGIPKNSPQMSSCSRWPKTEVEALIKLRTNLDLLYQDNGSKGPLWEEISSSMKKLGYDRSAKRCKEKWENINKYYKRVKESNKKRPLDSKTCPYFELLESLRVRKFKKGGEDSDGSGGTSKPEHILMHMMGPQQRQQQIPQSVNEHCEDQNQEDDGCDDDDDNDEEEEEEEEENADDYQIVASNPSSLTNME